MAALPEVTDRMIAQALIKKQGIQAHAAELLGITRSAVNQRIKANPQLQEVVAQIEEALLDTAENAVFVAMREGDARLAMDFLKQKGRKRGFGNKTELTGADGGPIAVAAELKVTIEYVMPKPEGDPEVPL